MIHGIDAYLAWSENLATQDGMLNGSISSTSLMVPVYDFMKCINLFKK